MNNSKNKINIEKQLNVKRITVMTLMMIGCSVIIGFIMTVMFYR